MKPTPTIPPPGFEILAPDTLRTYGAVAGMLYQPKDDFGNPRVDYERLQWPLGNVISEDACNSFFFIAPTGTTALLSTPLPESKCENPKHCSRCCGPMGEEHHAVTCPRHRYNRLVKVLPGWLEKCETKPKGLVMATAGCGPWVNCYKTWPFIESLKGCFAYAVPLATYDAIEAERKQFQNPVLSAEPNNRDCVSADEPRHPREHIGPNREFNSPDRDLSKPSPSAATPTDSEMLDWLEKYEPIIEHWKGAPKQVFNLWVDNDKVGRGPTLRAAIQNAMEGTK